MKQSYRESIDYIDHEMERYMKFRKIRKWVVRIAAGCLAWFLVVVWLVWEATHAYKISPQYISQPASGGQQEPAQQPDSGNP